MHSVGHAASRKHMLKQSNCETVRLQRNESLIFCKTSCLIVSTGHVIVTSTFLPVLCKSSRLVDSVDNGMRAVDIIQLLITRLDSAEMRHVERQDLWLPHARFPQGWWLLLVSSVWVVGDRLHNPCRARDHARKFVVARLVHVPIN